MSRFSDWARLCDANYRYDDQFCELDSPACYELGIGYSLGLPRKMYVGETGNFADRMGKYAYDGSHLCDKIAPVCAMGMTIFVRWQLLSSRERARYMQNNLLGKFSYEWNTQLNVYEDDDRPPRDGWPF